MYLCRKCGAEFIDPLGGRCPVCGVRVKPSWEEERAGEAVPPPDTGEKETKGDSAFEIESEGDFTFEIEPVEEEETPKPATTTSRPYRSPNTGVYGPPKSYGTPVAPSAPSRRGASGILMLSLIIAALMCVVGGVVFLLSGDCDMEEVVESFTEGAKEAVEGQKPLWRDRAAEMREAGYEPVAGLPPDLWPAAELTLWFVGDDGVIYYEAVKAPELSLLPLAGDVSLVGDIQPTPDGTGVVAVLRTGQGLGVYRLTPDGGSERLLDGEELYQRLMDEHSGEGDYAVELGRARSSGELLRQPRLDESTGTLYVAAGPPGDYEIWTADPETGKVEPFESYNTNLIPCLARGGVLYYQHHSAGPDQPALVYADDPATGDSDFIMTPGNAGGLISFDLGEDGTFAYLAVDYEDTPVVNYQRPDESFSENLKVPGDAPESVAVGPGGVIVVTGAYEGRDNVIFFNLDDLEGDDMPQIRYWTGISDIRSTRLGPPLTAP